MRFVLCLLLLTALTSIHGRTIDLNWTVHGVEPYRDRSRPLQTYLGDVLRLHCENRSNLFIQTKQIQHEMCNASAGSGKYELNGFCFAGRFFMLTLTQNSLDFNRVVNFRNNTLYYLTSYFNGFLSDIFDVSIHSGGECADGLKMVFVIGKDPDPPPPPPIPPSTEGDKPGDSDNLFIIIVAAGGGGGALLVILGVLSICICVCYLCNSKQPAKVDVELACEVDAKYDIDEKQEKPKLQPVMVKQEKPKLQPVMVKQEKPKLQPVMVESNATASDKRTPQVPKSIHKKETIKISSHDQSQVDKNGRQTVSEKEKKDMKKQNEVPTAKPKRGAASLKNGGSTTKTESIVVSSNTKPVSQIGSAAKAPKNGASNITAQKSTGAASSPCPTNMVSGATVCNGAAANPSQAKKGSRGNKTTVRNGPAANAPQVSKASRGDKTRVHNDGSHSANAKTSTEAKPRGAVSIRRPAPAPPKATQSLPPSAAVAQRHNRMQVQHVHQSLAPVDNKRIQTQRNRAVLFKPNNDNTIVLPNIKA